MRFKKRVYTIAALAAVAVLMTSTWGTGVGSAQGIPDHGPVEHPPDPGKNPNEQQTVVQYGPYTAQAAPEGDHWHSGNQIQNNVEKPCDNCYITSMTAALTDLSGNDVGVSEGLQLHHMVLFNRQKTDPTCQVGLPIPLGLLFGQRFFASGDERTVMEFPEGYGYSVGTGNFNLIWELANMMPQQQQVYYEVTYNWVPASTPMTDLEPIWFDIDQCGVSATNVPAGQSTRSWTWNVNRPGALTNIGGHQHGNDMDGGGVDIEIVNETTGELLCDSVAGYGETGMYVGGHDDAGWLSSMSKCGGAEEYDPVGMLSTGDQVTINAHYDQNRAFPDQMGIVMGWVAEDGPPPGNGDPPDPGSCETATNTQHAAAGRAYQSVFLYRATGSEQLLGLGSTSTSLEETSAGYWERVSSC